MNIQFNGRGFNCERAVIKTETEFVGLHLRTGFLPELKLADRFLLLKEAYALCLKAVGQESPAETEEETSMPDTSPVTPEEVSGDEVVADKPKKRNRK